MNYLLKLMYACLFLSCSFSGFSQSPQWNWGVRAGAGSNGPNIYPVETIWDMVTDKNGNVYYLGRVKADLASLSGTSGMIPLYGYDDILLASYDCEGNYRWHKIIGTSGPDGSDSFNGLGTDTLGGVYLTSFVSPNEIVKFGTDTSLPATNWKRTFFVKYDTSGNFKWLRMPEPDTIGMYANTGFHDIYVEPNGDIHALAATLGGSLSGSSSALAPGNYVLKYNKDGQLLGNVKLDYYSSMDHSNYTFCAFRMVRDPHNNNYYLSGQYQDYQGPFNVNGIVPSGSALVMAFNGQGQYLWHKSNTKFYLGFFGRPQLDGLGNITLIGTLFQGDAFGSYQTPSSQIHEYPFIVQLNSTGSVNWLIPSTSSMGALRYLAIQKVGNEIVVGGVTQGPFAWQGQPVVNYNGIRMQLFRFNLSTGSYIDTLPSFEILSGFGNNNFMTAMTSDRNNNLFIGGRFSDAIKVNNNTIYSNGGQTDIFMARLGYACDCPAPVAGFSYVAVGGSSVQFTYTGSGSYDSLSWDFGDGSPYVSTVSPIHSFASGGDFYVCVTALSDCGAHTYCEVLNVTSVGIEGVAGMASGIGLYPNPAGGFLTLSGASVGDVIEVYDIYGRRMLETKMRRSPETLDISSLAPGLYQLKVTGSSQKALLRFVKE